VNFATDENIMVQVRNGNLAQMSLLFDRYNEKLFNFFLKMSGNRALAEDLTQNTFYRAIKYKHTFAETSKFKSWIYQIARNIYNDHYNENKTWNTDFVKVENLTDSQFTLQHENANVEFELLDMALAKLSETDRQLVVLSKFQGLKYDEISQITGVSVAAIKVQMHRIIKKLREFYFEIQAVN